MAVPYSLRAKRGEESRRRPLHAVVSPRPSLGRREVCGYNVLVPELISAFNAPHHPARRAIRMPAHRVAR